MENKNCFADHALTLLDGKMGGKNCKKDPGGCGLTGQLGLREDQKSG